MSFGLYLIGYVLVIVGLAYGAFLAHVPTRWITALVLVMAGIGVVSAVTRTRQKDPN